MKMRKSDERVKVPPAKKPIWRPDALAMRLAGVLLTALVAPCAQGGIAFTTLYSFTGGNDGAEPNSALLQGADGNFYGTTGVGGEYGAGTVYQITPAGVFTNLFSFAGGSEILGASFAGLVQDRYGCLYGTTYGNGYGATYFGNSNIVNGSVFKMTTNGVLIWSVLFSGTNGSHPRGGLIQGADGNFYGTTEYGGTNLNNYIGNGYDGCGTVFKITPDGVLTSLYSFGAITNSHGWPSDGCNPYAALAAGADGNFYGTTYLGGTNNGAGWGTVFKITTNGILTTLYSFGRITGSSGQALDGAWPEGNLVQGADGNLYGTTFYGAYNGEGTVFKMTTKGTLIWSFASFGMGDGNGGNNGGAPSAGLVQGSDGYFYGTTQIGGDYPSTNHDNGTVFKITADGALTSLLSFSGSSAPNPGGQAHGAMVQGRDGCFYGTTALGGANDVGVIFRLGVPMPPVFTGVQQMNGAFTFTWRAVAGQMYQLQYNADPSSTNWNNLGGSFAATNGMMTNSDASPPDPQRFYRLILLP